MDYGLGITSLLLRNEEYLCYPGFDPGQKKALRRNQLHLGKYFSFFISNYEEINHFRLKSGH